MSTTVHRTLVAAASTALLAGPGVAFGAWTTAGPGLGEPTPSAAHALKVRVESARGLRPGGSVRVGFTVTNASDVPVTLTAASPQRLQVDSRHRGCGARHIAIRPVALEEHVAAGETSARHTITIRLAAASPDACQGAMFGFDVEVSAQ